MSCACGIASSSLACYRINQCRSHSSTCRRSSNALSKLPPLCVASCVWTRRRSIHHTWVPKQQPTSILPSFPKRGSDVYAWHGIAVECEWVDCDWNESTVIGVSRVWFNKLDQPLRPNCSWVRCKLNVIERLLSKATPASRLVGLLVRSAGFVLAASFQGLAITHR